MPLWTPTLCVRIVVVGSGTVIARQRRPAGSVRSGPRSSGTCLTLSPSIVTARSPGLLTLLRSRRGSVGRRRRPLDVRRSHRPRRLALPLRDRRW